MIQQPEAVVNDPRMLQVRLADTQQMRDAERVCFPQYTGMIVYEQGSPRIKPDLLPKRVPECTRLLDGAECMGGNDLVQPFAQRHLGKLDFKRVLMSIGREHDVFIVIFQALQKLEHTWPGRDQVGDLQLQRRHIEIEPFAPVVDTVPVKCPSDRLHLREYMCPGGIKTDPVRLGVATGYVLFPEVVVEVEVEECPVHVEQHGIDLRPRQVDWGNFGHLVPGGVAANWWSGSGLSFIGVCVTLQRLRAETIMTKPKILSTSLLAESRLFRIEALDMRFSNGANATFECLRAQGDGVVMVAAINDRRELVMVREYAACIDRYELGFVKGKIDPGESAETAAGRELIEETGFAASSIESLRKVYTSPGYNDFHTTLFIATGLRPAEAEGDEAEPLEQVIWPIPKIRDLFDHHEVNDARVLFMLTLLEKRFSQHR